MTKIAIILPTYNNIRFIKGSLYSIGQSFNDYHIYLGIDGCKETTEYLAKIDLSHLNISIFESEVNVGPYVIKNSLLPVVQEEKIVFFDTDDEMLKCFGRDISKAFQKSDYIRFLFDQEEIIKDKVKHKYTMPRVADGVFAIDKSLLLKFGGFYPWRCGADTEFMARLEHNKIEYFTINKPIFTRRIHADNLTMSETTNYRSDIRKQYMDIIEKKKISKNWKDPVVITTDLRLVYENKIA